MTGIKKIDWSLNMALSFAFFLPFFFLFGWKAALAFSFGATGAELSMLLMFEDVQKLSERGAGAVKLGFFKRYAIDIVILGISSTLSFGSLVSAFIGLELLRLTLTTVWRSVDT